MFPLKTIKVLISYIRIFTEHSNECITATDKAKPSHTNKIRIAMVLAHNKKFISTEADQEPSDYLQKKIFM